MVSQIPERRPNRTKKTLEKRCFGLNWDCTCPKDGLKWAERRLK